MKIASIKFKKKLNFKKGEINLVDVTHQNIYYRDSLSNRFWGLGAKIDKMFFNALNHVL